jgi:hypothetical protein
LTRSHACGKIQVVTALLRSGDATIISCTSPVWASGLDRVANSCRGRTLTRLVP